MPWSNASDRFSISDHDSLSYKSVCQQSSEASLHEVRQELQNKPTGTAWKEYYRIDPASQRTVDKHFGTAESILPPELSSEKSKKTNREWDYASTNYPKSSQTEPAPTTHKMASNPIL